MPGDTISYLEFKDFLVALALLGVLLCLIIIAFELRSINRKIRKATYDLSVRMDKIEFEAEELADEVEDIFDELKATQKKTST